MVNKWLHNDSFLKWKLFQSTEDQIFWENYIKENPDIKAEIDEAAEQLKSVKFNDYKLSKEEKQHIYTLIQKRIDKRKQIIRRRLFISLSATAACLALFILLSISPEKNIVTEKEDLMSMVTDSTVINKNDIQLIFADKQALTFEQNVDIFYNKSGEVIVNAGSEKITKKDIETDKTQTNKLIVPKGKRSSIVLEDGTKIWINSGSTLYFPSSFSAEKREIRVEGEIYIEVAKMNDIPFFVNSSRLSVEVLGTRFNISAYNDDLNHAVALVEGSVDVNIGNEKIHLMPDQMLSLDGDQLTTQNIDVYYYISWKDGLLQFTSEPLSKIFTRISRYYDIQIECDKSIENKKCTGKLVLFDDIRDVLRTLHNTISINYSIDENIISIKE